MLLLIVNDLRISDVRAGFAKHFPCLKIEFYRIGHHVHEECHEKYMISHDRRMGDVKNNEFEGFLEIKSWYSVARIEQDFREKFGLNVKIFRNENGTWVQTFKTYTYSLLQQSEMVCHAECAVYPSYIDQLGEWKPTA